MNNIVVKTEVQKIVVKNADGRDGKSAYQQAVEGGYTGTEQEFNCSLALLADVAEGKKQIADAINERGGSANPNSAFTQLAQNIEDIENFPTTGFEYISEIYRPRTLMEAYNNRYYLKSIKDDNIESITGERAFYYNPNLTSASFGKLKFLSGEQMFRNSGLTEFIAPNLLEINGNDVFGYIGNLEYISLPSLKSISGYQTFQASRMKIVDFPSLENAGENTFFNCTELLSIVVGKLSASYDIFISAKQKLRNITIGQGTNVNLPFQQWTANNVIAEGQSGIDELNSNLYNNLLTKLADHSQDGQTRTLRLGWLANVSQANIDYATAKGWTLTT